MRTLIVRLGTMSDAKARFVNAGRKALEGSAQPVTPSINFVMAESANRVKAGRIAITRINQLIAAKADFVFEPLSTASM